jgi:hypothetical protein
VEERRQRARRKMKKKWRKFIKGTVPPDFSPLFFFKQLLLVPVDKPRNDFNFFRIFAEKFDFSGASTVSLTPVKQTILL